MIEQDVRTFNGKRHRTVYFMGRRHVLYKGKLLKSMRVFQWFESEECHRELFDRF